MHFGDKNYVIKKKKRKEINEYLNDRPINIKINKIYFIHYLQDSLLLLFLKSNGKTKG